MPTSHTRPLAQASALGCATALAFVLSACGSGAQAHTASGASRDVTLTVTASDGRGQSSRATLSCHDGPASATGFLRTRAARACSYARARAAFLDAVPSRGRICTQIYGGPDTARVRGRIAARTIDRRFSRRNGCEIADWDAAVPLLPARPRR